MIIGIGTDICCVERIRRSLRRFSDDWIDHLFSENEQRLCSASIDPGLLYARSFCGKEACAKALGTGFSNGIAWREIEVLQTPYVTTLCLKGDAREHLIALTPKYHRAKLSITCSGDRRLVKALVVAFAISD